MLTRKPVNSRFTSRLPKSRRSWAFLGLGGLVIILVASMLIGIIAGPSIGGVFSKTTSGFNASYGTPAESVDAPAAVAQNGAAPAPGASKSGTTTSTTTGGSGTGYNIANQQNSPDRMVIRNATVSLISEDVEKTLADVRALVGEQQGLVASSNTSLRGDKTYATIVIQVPGQVYDATMARLRKIAYKVESENSTSQDVTEEFVDTEAQVRNLKASEVQLLALLQKATNVSDTLQIQREITAVRGEIERRQGRLNFLQKKTDFSTISLTIAPRLATTDTPKTGDWDFGKVLENAWSGSLRGLQGLATVSITLAVYLVWLLPLGALAIFLMVFGWRKAFPRRPDQGSSTPPTSGDPETATV